MKFKAYTPAEVAAWKCGKIAAYYALKRQQGQKSSGQVQNAKYNNFSVDYAFQKAFERTYGSKK